MIAWLSGRIIEKKPTRVILDVGGVGYGVSISLNTFYSMPEAGEDARLFIHTSVRDDAIQLFGFSGEEEKEAFEKLIGVSRIGPKMAVTILSGLTGAELARAVTQGDAARLGMAPGIGRKTAERLIVELKDKFEKIEPAQGAMEKGDEELADSVTEALVSLGYKRKEAQSAAAQAVSRADKISIEEALRESLKILGRA